MQELKELIVLLNADIAEAEDRGFLPANLAILKLLIAAHERMDMLGELYEVLKPMTAEEFEATKLQGLRHLQEDQHTSIMIGFWLDPEAAQKLAIPGGEAPEELHVTLCYLGKIDEFGASLEDLKNTLARFVENKSPLIGHVGGIGRLTPSESSEGLSPIVALVNMPGLQEWRRRLVSALDLYNIAVAETFDFLPHCTLAYIDADAPMPIQNIKALPLTFNTLWLCVGDERIPYKLEPLPPEEEPSLLNQFQAGLTAVFNQQRKAIEAVATGTATLETIGDPLDLSDDDLDKLSEITDDDLKKAAQLWDDNAPDEFKGMLNAEKVEGE